MEEINFEVLRIEHAISLSCTLNAKFRNQVNVSLTEVARLNRHVSNIENHAKYLQNLNEEFESSLSWKVTAPLRSVARFIKRVLR